MASAVSSVSPFRNVDYFEELKTTLRRMVQDDQFFRQKDNPDTNEIDIKHNHILKEIIQKIGWPKGEEESQYMWILVQHQDEDLNFQKECLILLEEAVQQENASPIPLAYLTDRIRVFEGQNQIYGTQWKYENNKWSLCSVENMGELNERLERFGMPSIEKYKQDMMEMYSLTEEDFI